ncbi:MAG TPA: EamA family transporter [Methylomirabilota bacterium]|nr:EamA family transporter [Methylomirabilota bacterium]
MTTPIVFALLAGVSAATYTICVKVGSSRISAVVGAIVITGGALVVNTIVLIVMRAGGHQITVSREGLLLMAAAGLAAAGVDLFSLFAYQHGLRVTSSFLIGGTSTLVVILAGFLLLHEPFTWLRLLAIALISAGMLLYQIQGS